MKNILAICAVLLTIELPSKSQDYFADLNSGTTPILSANDRRALFSATINAGDNSIKANFFRQYSIDNTRDLVTNNLINEYFLGWGINTKAKVESGISSLFGSGNFIPGFYGGAYFSLTKMKWTPLNEFSLWAWVLSGTVSSSKFQFYNPIETFDKQLTDASFTGKSISLSHVRANFHGADNIIGGVSFTGARLNNYSKLTKVELKNDSIFTNGAGMTRIVQQVNDDGYIFAVGNYKEYTNWTFRPFITYIPGLLGNRIGFTLYPSLDLSNEFNPKYNIAIAFSLLKAGSPTLTDAALFIELNDLSNASNSTDNFLKRAIKVGISTSLNIFGN